MGASGSSGPQLGQLRLCNRHSKEELHTKQTLRAGNERPDFSHHGRDVDLSPKVPGRSGRPGPAQIHALIFHGGFPADGLGHLPEHPGLGLGTP